MSRKNISQEKIIQSFLASAFEKSAGATSLADVSDSLEIKKASLYNHFESKENMYASTLELCGKEINIVSFLSDKTIDTIKNGKTALLPLLKKLITRYFNLFETEPLFQMYVFVRTEQYFNLEALKIVRAENEKITDELRKVFQAFMDIEKIQKCSEKELREKSGAIAAIIIQQRDLYIANRKEIVRQNPESGAGTLFALPTDNDAINKAIKMVEFAIKSL